MASRTCYKCYKRIPENKKYIKLEDGSRFHCHCFTCNYCSNPIPYFQYIEEEPYYYHKKCFLKMKHPCCCKCFKRLRGKTIKISEEELYHEECFTCFNCEGSIEGKFLKIDSLPCCPGCFKQLTTTCGSCKKPIEGERFKGKNMKSYHPECFKCSVCHLDLGEGVFMTKEDRLYHKKCYKEKYCLRCDGCDRILEGDYVKAINGGKYHFKCFKGEPKNEPKIVPKSPDKADKAR